MIIQGSGSDTDLSPTGRLQAEKLGLAMKDVPLTAIYSSPLRRAMDTATAIAKCHNLKIRQEPRLKEIFVGEMEGTKISALNTNFTQFLLDWQTSGEDVDFKGGENLGQFRDRVWESIQKIVRENRNGTVAVVSHYFVTAVVVCHALGLPLTHLTRIRIQPSGKTIMEFSQGCPPRLLLLSDICHLRENRVA